MTNFLTFFPQLFLSRSKFTLMRCWYLWKHILSWHLLYVLIVEENKLTDLYSSYVLIKTNLPIYLFHFYSRPVIRMLETGEEIREENNSTDLYSSYFSIKESNIFINSFLFQTCYSKVRNHSYDSKEQQLFKNIIRKISTRFMFHDLSPGF